ncbi:aliphatic sulfonate ABC transporter substrate-binding protein [Homoserinibacter sp. GY 40078]|uniref:aliphatic sulfonate ABC transporter substrate-binding protein n=1 Tax=Homoserinibacter sp. GY 40078 TaxID=2603275 RepID=UPI0011C847FB|nr:aliphatic sulfonate ABC transporter substrate-binding protein [Homoserinibacter sp. GY 40078]TXK17541.1 aliphatic sulfonate ABC transporter substrate-binding protein [Homoserinibacter sp. GY 40078]
MIRRRLPAIVAAAAVAALALAGCAGENAPTDAGNGGEWSSSTLNLDFATYNPLSLIIKQQGWIEDTLGDDVSVTWTQSLGSNKANEGLRAGALDVGSTAGSAALLARANGSPIKTIDIYTQPEWSALATLPGSGIESVADLRGKTVAVTVGTDPYFFLLQALDEAGVGVDEVEIQNLQHADGGTALVNGSVDAWSGLDPMLAAHEINDGVELFYRNVDFNTYGFLNATEDFITNHADLAQVVVDAYEKARAWALENPQETAELLAEVAGIDQAVADKVLLERTVIDLDNVPGQAQLDVLKVVAPIQVENGDIPTQQAADDALASLFDTTFAEAADPSRVG